MQQLEERQEQEQVGRRAKFFYGWVVVFALLCLQGAAVGILNNTMSVFYGPVSEGLHVSRAIYSLYSTFGTMGSMLMAPVWGEVFRKRRFKPFMLGGCFVIGATMYGYSLVTNIYQFYFLAVFKSVCQGMVTGIPVARILQNWFVQKRGTATGIALAGSGLAGMVMTPIVASTVEATGWRSGFQQLAIVYLIITIPVIALLVREKPSDIGLEPLGYDPSTAPKVSASGMQSGMTRKQALRSKTFYLYVAGLMLTQITAMGMQNNIINHMTDIGYGRVFAALIFSTMMGVLVIGKIVLGRIYDKWGMSVGVFYSGLLMLASTILLPRIQPLSETFEVAQGAGVFGTIAAMPQMIAAMPTPFVFAAIFGLAHAMTTMQLPYMTVRLFGEKEYTRVYSILTPSTQIGMAIGTPAINGLQEIFGSYVPVFYGLSVFAILLIICLTTAFKTAPVEIDRFDREDGLVA